MSLLRRLVGEVRDTLLMGGLASAGGARHERTAMPLQTRFVADSVLPLVRDEDEQSERARAAWSLAGAAALAGLGLMGVADAMQSGLLLVLLLGAGLLLVAAGVVWVTFRRSTRGSRVHLAGVVLAAAWLVAVLVAPTIVSAERALLMLLLAFGAVVGLVVGRR